MRYQPLPNSLFKQNRKNLLKTIKSNSLVIILSNDIITVSGDGVLPFQQQSNFYYFSGIDQEESMLILAPDHPDQSKREILFVKETSEIISVWEGHKLSKNKATSLSGVENVQWSKHFQSSIKSLLPEIDQVYLDFEENPRANQLIKHRNERFTEEFIDSYPLVKLERLQPIVTQLRMIKSDEEVSAVRKAGEISTQGYNQVLQVLKPGLVEYEVEAEFIYQFIKSGSNGFAFNPIIASGKNACILHYEQNNAICRDGDLVLMDVGAEYANYKSDITRTYPVNGKFSARQKEIYEAVLLVKNKATYYLRPGVFLKDYNKYVGKEMEEVLIGLDLLRQEEVRNQDPDKPLYRKYYMHSTSHHLGLDVHDISSAHTPIAAGMLLTVEPGIYIKEEGIGIRLEDDILIGENQNTNLTESIPIEIESIEGQMSTGTS